jgi:YidC/Oxa1 family membrane protein insertase
MAVGLPTLLQLPIVFSLYRVLGSYISLYNAPFALWITDLSYKDPYFILPLLLGFGVFFQQRLSKSVSSNDDVMAKVTKYGMPIILFFVFSGLPAGLVLYWLCNSLALIVEEGLFSFFTLGQKTGFVVVNRD